MYALAVDHSHNITWSCELPENLRNVTLRNEIWEFMANEADSPPEDIDEIFLFDAPFHTRFVNVNY